MGRVRHPALLPEGWAWIWARGEGLPLDVPLLLLVLLGREEHHLRDALLLAGAHEELGAVQVGPRGAWGWGRGVARCRGRVSRGGRRGDGGGACGGDGRGGTGRVRGAELTKKNRSAERTGGAGLLGGLPGARGGAITADGGGALQQRQTGGGETLP